MKACEGCGSELHGRQRRYCSDACRKRAERRGVNVAEGDGAFVAKVMEDLEAAGKLDSLDGQHAIALAKLMGGSMMNTSGVAALSKQFMVVMDRAMAGYKAEADPVDEIRKKRDAKLGRQAG